MKLLWEEREVDNPGVEDHRKFRRRAEEILGPDENLFRIDWVWIGAASLPGLLIIAPLDS